jgi:predicted TIM-barrel fold metal-dependent hydrolase
MRLTLLAACLSAGISAAGSAQSSDGNGPAADHHQHLFSPAIAAMLSTDSNQFKGLTADDIVPLLDSAGIRRATVLSIAYMYGSPSRSVEDEYAKVRAENDWTAKEVAKYPERLVVFCGFNPLKEYAVRELARCSKDPHLRRGIKLHLGNSDVQLQDPTHIAQLRRVFKAANDRRIPIVVHLRANISRKRPYGPIQARAFLEQVLPVAQDIPIQVAHLAGTGPGYDDPPADSVMAVLAGAVARNDPRTRRLFFDVTSVVDREISADNAALVAKRIRQVGVERVLYGTDAAVGDNLRPRESWAAFRRLPLTDAEFERIAGNEAPYLE